MVKLLQEWISDEGADGKTCHASSVTELPDGRIAAAWFAGTNEKNPDVDIVVGIRPAALARGIWQKPVFTAASLTDPGTTGGKVSSWPPWAAQSGCSAGRSTLYIR